MVEAARFLFIVLLGFASGFTSGAFGVGGGVITTPAIRLLLSQSSDIALGTPLPVILPSARSADGHQSCMREIESPPPVRFRPGDHGSEE